LDALVLDIKCGKAAFMTNITDAKELAESLVNTANSAGCLCEGFITRMDYPLGDMIGNACEIWECVRAMDKSSEYM